MTLQDLAAGIRLDRLLGRGASADVVLAKVAQQRVAIKILLPASPEGRTQSDEVNERLFREEATTMARLQSPQLIQCLGIMSLPASTPGLPSKHTEEALCMCLEYMEAGSLARMVVTQMTNSKHIYTEYEALVVLRDVALGLLHLHSQSPPIIHRDLKMENILLTRQGGSLRAKLADLGLHRCLDRNSLPSLLRRKLAPSQACAGSGKPVLFYAQPESHMYISTGGGFQSSSFRAAPSPALSASNSLVRTAPAPQQPPPALDSGDEQQQQQHQAISTPDTTISSSYSSKQADITAPQPPAVPPPAVSQGTEQHSAVATQGRVPGAGGVYAGLNRGSRPQTAPLTDIPSTWAELQPVLSLSSRTSPPNNPERSHTQSPSCASMYGSAGDATTKCDLPTDLPTFLSTPQSSSGREDMSAHTATTSKMVGPLHNPADLHEVEDAETSPEVLQDLLARGSASVKDSLSTALSSVPITPSASAYASPGPNTLINLVQRSSASGTEQGAHTGNVSPISVSTPNYARASQQPPLNSNPLFSTDAGGRVVKETWQADDGGLYAVVEALRQERNEGEEQGVEQPAVPEEPGNLMRSSLTAALKQLRASAAESTTAVALDSSSHHRRRQSRRQSRRLSRASWSFDEAGPSTSALLAAEAADVVGAMPLAFNRWVKPRPGYGGVREPLFGDDSEDTEWDSQVPVTHSVPSDLYLLGQRFGSSGGDASTSGTSGLKLIHGGKRPLNSFVPQAGSSYELHAPGFTASLRSRMSYGIKKFFNTSGSPDNNPAALAASLMWSSHGRLHPLTPSTRPSTPSTRLSLASRPSEQPGTAERQAAMSLLSSSHKSQEPLLGARDYEPPGSSRELIAKPVSQLSVGPLEATNSAPPLCASADQAAPLNGATVAKIRAEADAGPQAAVGKPVAGPIAVLAGASAAGSVSVMGSSAASVSSCRSWLQLPHPPDAGPGDGVPSNAASSAGGGGPLSSNPPLTSSGGSGSQPNSLTLTTTTTTRNAPSRLGKMTLPGSTDIALDAGAGAPAVDPAPSPTMQPSPFSAAWMKQPEQSEQPQTAGPAKLEVLPAQGSSIISFQVAGSSGVAPTPTLLNPQLPVADVKSARNGQGADTLKLTQPTTSPVKPQPIHPELPKPAWFNQLSVKGMSKSSSKGNLHEMLSRSARGPSNFSIHGQLLNLSRGAKRALLPSQSSSDSIKNASQQGGLKKQMSHLVEVARQALSPEFQWVFQLTSETGSCMYMAPEVFKHEPYNESIDVYSFGIVAYEVLTRTMLVFTHVGQGRQAETSDAYAQRASEGYRPERANCLSNEQWQLIEACWSQDPLERPTMKQVVASLDDMLQNCEPSYTSGSCSCCTIS